MFPLIHRRAAPRRLQKTIDSLLLLGWLELVAAVQFHRCSYRLSLTVGVVLRRAMR